MKVNKLFLTTMLTCLPLYVMARETTPNDTLPHSWSDTILINRGNHGFKMNKLKSDLPINSYMASPSGEYEAFIFQSNHKGEFRIVVRRKGEKVMLWDKKFNASTCTYRMTRYGVLEAKQQHLKMLSYTTGKPVWKASTNSYSGCMDGYAITEDVFGGIYAHSLRTGKIQWKSSISHNGGLCYIKKFDDARDYLVADNIYKIDWRNGYTKSIKANTYIQEPFSELKDANKLYLLLGIVSYKYDIKVSKSQRGSLCLSPENNYTSGIASDILNCNGRNYFADRKSVICFDDDMNEIWRTKVDDGDPRTFSTLQLAHDKLFVISRGYADRGARIKNIAVPMVSAYNASDGTHIFTEKLRIDNMAIRDTYVKGDSLYMMLENEFVILNMSDNKISRMKFDDINNGSLGSFLCDYTLFVNDDNAFYPFANIVKNIPVLTDKGLCYDIDMETGSVKAINGKSLYRVIGELNGKTILQGGTGDGEVWCIDGGKASLLNDEAKKVWVNEDNVTIMNKGGNIIIYTALGNS